MGDNDLDERRKRCAELQAKYPEGLLPPCHIDHDAMCRDHTLAVLNSLSADIRLIGGAAGSPQAKAAYGVVLSHIDAAIKAEEEGGGKCSVSLGNL